VTPYYTDDLVTVYHGDCVEVMPQFPESSVDAIVTDPPYDLTSIVRRFGREGAAPAKPEGMGGAFTRLTKGFMGQTWDGTGVAFRVETWAAAWRVLRPGGHLLAFGGTRTSHRMVCAIEDAGFEIRDTLAWLYGSGWPKGHSHLKPAFEPIVLARKPLAAGSVAANVLAYGTGALNVDGCRIDAAGRPLREVAPLRDGVAYRGNALEGRLDGSHQSSTAVGTTDTGRWPANVVLGCACPTDDHDSGCAAALLDAQSGSLTSGRLAAHHRRHTPKGWSGPFADDNDGPAARNAFGGDTGGASRFFYTSKASPAERQRVTHPTVKPVALMRWLCRLVTPPGGVVLDCFAGSGTTRLAALAEGFRCILIEQQTEYLEQLCGRAAQTALALDGDAAG
jgi:site-specific DNA-methyltransferase (adenine-specific)